MPHSCHIVGWILPKQLLPNEFITGVQTVWEFRFWSSFIIPVVLSRNFFDDNFFFFVKHKDDDGHSNKQQRPKEKTKIMKIYDCECPWSFIILEAHASRDVFLEREKNMHCTCVCDLKHVHQKS